jgi:hypothetical protein
MLLARADEVIAFGPLPAGAGLQDIKSAGFNQRVTASHLRDRTQRTIFPLSLRRVPFRAG